MSDKLSGKYVNQCRDSFVFFLFQVWKHLALPKPTKRQIEIAYYLQHGPKRSIIQAFRGIGKSWITAAFVCWLLLRNPQLKILVVSASKDRADAFTTFTLRLIKEMPVLMHLTPRHDQRESMVCFDVAPSRNHQAPSMKSAGIFGMITGSRADYIIGDDVEIPNNSATVDMREKLINRVGEFEDILVPEGEPRIIFLGTPQTEESIYNKLRSKSYDCRIWPARAPSPKQVEGYAGGLSPKIQQEIDEGKLKEREPTDPQRFHESDLIEREAAKGRSAFQLQFMLDTTLSDTEKYPLKLGDLIVMDLNPEKAPSFIQYGSGPQQTIPELQNMGFAGDRWYGPMFYEKETWKKYETVVMSVDPAGRGADMTGWAVIAQLHGKLFILDAGGFHGGYIDENLEFLAYKAKEFKVNDILIEANFGDGMWMKLFEPILGRIHPCHCEEVRHSKQKEMRIIDCLEPVLNQHRVVINRALVEKEITYTMDHPELNTKYSLFFQITRITKQRGALRHDDKVDALSIGVGYFVDMMARDEKKADQQYKDQRLQEEIDRHLKEAGIFKPKGGLVSERFNRAGTNMFRR